jgi:NAD(P)H dehydrogenase (quinone)
MNASAKKGYPIATVETLEKYDAFLFGIPTRFGNMPAQLKVNHHRIFWSI